MHRICILQGKGGERGGSKLKISEFNNLSFNETADYWRYEVGANVIPANTRKKSTFINWKQYQDSPISKEQHEQWKANNAFNDGMAIIAGKAWHANTDRYLILVDLDNKKAIDEFCTRNDVMTPLNELAKSMIIEQHDDEPGKAHIIFYASRPFAKKSSSTVSKAISDKLDKNEIPAIEIKGKGEHGILFVTPSVHKNGHPYHIIGTKKLDDCLFFDALETHLDNICNKYGIPYLIGTSGSTKQPINELFNEDTRIHEGHNRHEALLRAMESLLRRNQGILTHEQIKPLAIDWNQNHCIPPLDMKKIEEQWKDAIHFIKRHDTDIQKGNEKYPELKGNIYYQINEKPEKYIIAYRQKNQVIEVTAKTEIKKVGRNEVIEKYLVHNKTYLACITVKIIRHKNPLTFLETSAKYTIKFVDSVGETQTFKHKTLAEILQGLRDLGYVLSDSSDTALGAMVQAYKENKQIEDNEDIEYIGFFTDKDNKIIASNLEIKQPPINELVDSIKFLIEELKPHYENRLDLLATSIVWGMVAPVIFMLKTNNYFLKALHLYGFSNATKSNTGKIILALDGHDQDSRFAMQFSRIDTPARLGDAVSHSTFPILIDEMDLSDPRNAWLVNLLKSIIESRLARTKFPHSKASNPIDIPALSCLILTSNSPPPFHESAYMRRVIARNFPQSETWKESDPKAIEFREFLRINLPRLKALGDFRNWFIMNHQDEILDEKRPDPLDLGLKILQTAFEYTGIEIPTWLLEQRLSENQLEESIQDNEVIVKRAFEKYIDEQINRALPIWRQELDEHTKLELPHDISDRLVKLAESNVLPDIKYAPLKHGINIHAGILTELYNHGITRDQLPNLRALSDYMNTEFTKSHGKKVVFADKSQLTKYFDGDDGDDGDT